MEKIFWKIFLNKYLQKIFSIPKCYTILESWDQMLSHGFYRKWIWKKKINKKSNLALVGHNLNSRKNLQKQVPRNEPAPPHVDYHPTLVVDINLCNHPSHLSPYTTQKLKGEGFVVFFMRGRGGAWCSIEWQPNLNTVNY